MISVLHGIVWYFIVLHTIALYHIVLLDIALYCMVTHCIVLNLTVLHGIAWYCIVPLLASARGLYIARHLYTLLDSHDDGNGYNAGACIIEQTNKVAADFITV